MNTHESQNAEEHSTRSAPKSITIRLPKLPRLSMQTLVLALVLIVAIFQTAELFGLQRAINGGSFQVTAPANAATLSAPSAPSSGALPEMVGGC